MAYPSFPSGSSTQGGRKTRQILLRQLSMGSNFKASLLPLLHAGNNVSQAGDPLGPEQGLLHSVAIRGGSRGKRLQEGSPGREQVALAALWGGGQLSSQLLSCLLQCLSQGCLNYHPLPFPPGCSGKTELPGQVIQEGNSLTIQGSQLLRTHSPPLELKQKAEGGGLDSRGRKKPSPAQDSRLKVG